MQSCSFSTPKEDGCECSKNNINSVNVKEYFQVRANLRINRDEISDEMYRIVELLNVRTECRYRYAKKKKKTHSVRAKNAECTCIHSTISTVQRWAL